MKNQTETTVVSLARNYREAPLRPTSLNEEARTVEVVWATTTPVLRFHWETGKPYWEVLSLDPAHIVLDRFRKGLSVLDSHNRATVDAILGVAENPLFPEGHAESTCTATFSNEHPFALRVFKDIKAGIIRHWSFSYDVLRLEKTERQIDGIPVYLSTLWEAFELSVVPVPADPNAGARAHEDALHFCEVVTFRGAAMTDEEKKSLEEEEKKRKEEEAKKKREDAENAASDDKEGEGDKGKKGKKDDEGARSLDASRAAEQVRKAERRRISEIRAAHAVMPTVMDETKVQEYIDNGADADAFRRDLFEAARAVQPKIDSRSHFEMGAEQAEKKRELMSLAILHRTTPDRYRLDSGDAAGAREFRGMTLLDMAKDCLDSSGFRWRGHAGDEIARIALGGRVRGMHATTDFPALLSNTINKSLRDAYVLAKPTYEAFCRRATVRDFKERNLVQIGDVGKFRKIVEGGEYKATTVGEATESYRVYKYGNRFGIYWETIINDDLDAFNRIPVSIANEAAQHCADIVYDILLKNPKMGDGKPLFDAAHNNVGAAADIDLTGMDAAFTAIGTQKNSNDRILNLHPEYLIVGHGKRTKALQYLNDTVVPTKADDVTPAQMRGLQPIVEGRIPGNAWFLACSPGIIDTIEYAYLEGEEGLFTEERWGFEVDGLEIKARLVFGAKAIDWRGLYKNPGIA